MYGSSSAGVETDQYYGGKEKKAFKTMLIAKGRLKKTFVHYLMRLVTPSPNRDEDKPETFNAFFTSVFNTDAQSPGLEDHKTGRDKLPLDFELTQNLLLQLNAQIVHGT